MLSVVFAPACALSHELREWDGSVVRATVTPHDFGRGFVEIAADGTFAAQRMNRLESCVGMLSASESSVWLDALEDADVAGRDGVTIVTCDHCPSYEVAIVSASGAEGRVAWNGRVPRELDALAAVLRATLDRARDCTPLAGDASTMSLRYGSFGRSDDLFFSVVLPPGGPPRGFVKSIFPAPDGDGPECPDAIADAERTALLNRVLTALPEPPLESAVEHRARDGSVQVFLAYELDSVRFYVDPTSALGTELTERALRCPRLD